MSARVPRAARLGPRMRGPAAAALSLALTLAAVFPAAVWGATHTAPNPNRRALAAVADVRAAITAIQQAAALTTSGPDRYKQSAHQALNALVGADSRAYRADAGNPADRPGALGHLDWLLHRPGSPPWAPAVHAAWVHVVVARSRLEDALRAKDLDSFAGDMSDALESLEMALGRRSQGDSIGALTGAIATTELGVPAGARVVDGCRRPQSAPAYGVVDGKLVYVALPLHDKGTKVPSTLAATAVKVSDGYVVIDTPAADASHHLCAQAKDGTQASATTASARNTTDNPKLPALYTKAQAKHGKKIFAEHCQKCHGKNMQGTSAPPNGGRAFLKKADALGWSMADMRRVVVDSMPMNNPGTLSAEQYSAVLAYLLATDCYPAGDDAFPTEATAKLKDTALKLPRTVKPDHPDTGTCELH